jgi:hypothetical protein
MQDVDFLPAQYRDLSARRNIKLSRFVVVGAIILALVGTAVTQSHLHRQLVAEVDGVKPLHESAELLSQELKDTQTQLANESKMAALVTYLRHPWPRTQLLAVVMDPLPETLSLDQITISEQAIEAKVAATQTSRIKRAPVNSAKATADADKLLPAERDLKQLRETTGTMQTVIIIAGRTRDRAELYKYLGRLGESDLIVKAELKSLEAAPDVAAASKATETGEKSASHTPSAKFVARLVVKRAHGQTPPTADEIGQQNT